MNELLTYYSDFQRFGLNFYLNTPNSGGVGVVYARLRVGDYLSRFSLGLRCRVEYWDKTNGTIKLNRATMTKTDWEIYNAFSVVLNNIHNVVGEKLEYYICTPQLDKTTLEIGKELTDTINLNTKRMKKKKVKTPLISKLRGLVAEYDNKKSQSSLFGIVNTFARFLEVLGVEDIIENVNNDLMIKWREWLDIEKYSVARVKACVGVIFNLLAKLERKHGYDFKLNKTKLEPIRDKRSVEEKRDNGIALTFEEIEKIKNAPLDNAVAVIESKDKIWLEIARDMFLIQCFCGCRVEDLSLLLNSKHHTKEGEIYYSTFKTQKRGITSIIPLNTLFPDALELVQRYTDKCPLNTQASFLKYNRVLRQLAKLAELDREITYTGQKGGTKYVEVNKLYDVISSHCGRHTFITNCIREKGLTPDKVKLISGHADTKLIESVYANLTKEDNKRILNKAILETNTTLKNNGEIESVTDKDKRQERANIGVIEGNKSPLEFALWLVRELGIKTTSGELGLPQLFTLIKAKKESIIKKYGEKRYNDIKTFLGVGLGKVDKKRLELLFCKALGKRIKLVGEVRDLRL